VVVLQRGQMVQARWLGATLVGITLLLALRLAVTALENARLLREERLAEQRLVLARAEERNQLLADMHDGFGSQLVSARVRSQRGTLTQPQLTELLGECLADLHLVVDALKAQEGSLSSALDDYRHRIERRLEGGRCALHWELRPGDEADISSHVILQVLRVVQEAVNNALKHARADNVWVAVVRQEGGALEVSVMDDGVGLQDGARSGRGRTFMEARARSLGARFSLGPREGDQPGTSVRVTVPPAVLQGARA
jgi:signal transduction histidine kinase